MQRVSKEEKQTGSRAERKQREGQTRKRTENGMAGKKERFW